MSFKEESEHLGLDQESGKWPAPEGDGEQKMFPESQNNRTKVERRVMMNKIVSARYLLKKKGGITTGNCKLILRQGHTIWSIMT